MRVGVALATYDGARHLPAQLASLAAQVRLPDVVVVRDDGSSDATPDLLTAFERDAPFAVRLLPPGPRLGSTRSFEVALDALRREERADVVLLCDQDDVWRADKTARLLDALGAAPRALLACSDARLVDEDGDPLGGTAWGSVGLTPDRRDVLAGDDALPLLLDRSLLTGMTFALRAPLLDVALPFPAEVRDASVPELLHDRWLSLVAAALGPVAAVPEPLADYRRHAAQQLGLRPDGEATPVATGTRARRLARLRDRSLGDRVTAELDGAARRARVLRDALAARGVDGPSVRRVQDEVRHLEAVLGLPPDPLRRLPRVVRELRRGGYGRRGRNAALDDVLRRTSGGSRPPR